MFDLKNLIKLAAATTLIKFKTRSAALPRGRYFKPINSKLGAKLSTKF